MSQFDTILQAASQRKGGLTALEDLLVNPEPPENLAMVGEDRYLSVMCRRIFRAGLTHRLVDARWPAFEMAFGDFDLEYVANLTDDDLKQLSQDENLIRHRRKIFAVRDNARAMQNIAQNFGSFGTWVAEWPEEKITQLWQELKDNFTQMGGNSAPSFLRMIGKDTFLLTSWVKSALYRWDIYTDKTHTKKGLQKIQSIFNDWACESGRPLCQLSQILAFSMD